MDLNLLKNEKAHIQKKVNVALEFIVELYRVLIGSCLIIFVPQDCDGNSCNPLVNLSKKNVFYNIAFFFNISTLISFLILYGIEMTRENRLIDYLDSNNEISNDNESVGKRIDKLDILKRESILDIDILYYRSGYIAIVFFIINTMLSSIVVFEHYLNNNTAIGFSTNILFMTIKLYNVRLVLSTEKNIFYSAYLTNFVQFNDLDKKEKEKLKQNMVFIGMEELKLDNYKNTDDILNYMDSSESSIALSSSEENSEENDENVARL